MRQESAETMQEAFAKGTLQNIRIQVGKFQTFCEEYGRGTRPVSVNTLIMYIEYLGSRFSAVNTIKSYINGVKIWHMTGGYKTTAFDSYALKLMFRGMERKLQHKVHQALPVTPEILLKIRQVIDLKAEKDITKWALYLIAFFLVCRKSNLVPDSAKSFDPQKQLTRGHFEEIDENLRVIMKWTKTIQYNERQLVVPIRRIKGSKLCPVKAYKRMCTKNPATQGEPAFVHRGKKGKMIVWTYRMFMTELKKDIEKIGEDPRAYSTHSFRRGAATFAYEAGVEAETVKIMGDWRSDCFRQYLQVSMQKKEEAAIRMGEKIKNIEGHENCYLLQRE